MECEIAFGGKWPVDALELCVSISLIKRWPPSCRIRLLEAEQLFNHEFGNDFRLGPNRFREDVDLVAELHSTALLSFF